MNLKLLVVGGGLLTAALLVRPSLSWGDGGCCSADRGTRCGTVARSGPGPSPETTASGVRVSARNGRYAVTVDGSGFHPSTVRIPAGKPATVVFTRTSDQTCAKELVIPALNFRHALPLGKPVAITVPASKMGALRFACGMDMMTGVVQIEGARPPTGQVRI